MIALVCAGSAFAQTAYQNNIGVYFDEAGTILINNDGVVGAKDVYVVLTNLTVDTVKGFECKLTAEGGLVLSYSSITFPVNAGVLFAANNSTAPGEPVATQGTTFDNLKTLYR